MSIERKLWKKDRTEGGFEVSSPGVSLLKSVGIGMVAGVLVPFVVLLQGLVIPSREVARLIVLFGPPFGGATAYFMHRFRRVERTSGELPWALLSGALAGGFTASLAYYFEYLESQWHVAGGVAAGAAALGFLWWQGSRGTGNGSKRSDA